jgi:hypothetical protein
MKKKNFDCVQMKHEIQKKLMKQTAGLTLEERNRRLEKSLASNPILGPFLKKVSAAKKGSSK